MDLTYFDPGEAICRVTDFSHLIDSVSTAGRTPQELEAYKTAIEAFEAFYVQHEDSINGIEDEKFHEVLTELLNNLEALDTQIQIQLGPDVTVFPEPDSKPEPLSTEDWFSKMSAKYKDYPVEEKTELATSETKKKNWKPTSRQWVRGWPFISEKPEQE